MDYSEFERKIKSSLPIGTVLKNPGGGISTIMAYKGDILAYKRAKSTIHVSLNDLYKAYNKYKGMNVNSTDLREYAPHIFDSKQNGHSCNCTFLFMVLKSIGLVSTILGEGKRGNPFHVTISAD